VLISGPGTEDGSRARKAGADACLAWPVSQDVLALTIGQLLRAGEAQKRLREIDETFHSTFEQAAIGLGHMGLDRKWLWANKRLCQMFGYTLEEFLQRTGVDTVPPENTDARVVSRQQVISGERESFAFEQVCRRKDGSEFWGSFAVTLARKPDGQPRHFVVVANDISVRKWSENNLMRIRAAIEGSSEAIAISDAEGRLSYTNQAFNRMFGCRIESLRSPHATMPLYVDQEVGRKVYEAILQAKSWNGEVEMLDGHGRQIQIELRADAMQDERGRVIGLIEIHTDITRRKQLEVQLRRSHRMEAIGQLAGGVAHDFNNLLAVIQGNAELLVMTDEQLSKEGGEYLQNIVRASESAASLSRQLLIFSRKQIMESRPVMINDLVKGLVKMLGRVIREDIRLDTSCEEGLPLVLADSGMIEQVLMNLVVNARDAMPDGGHLCISTGRVTVDASYARTNPEARLGEFVCLRVSDTGVGILPEALPRIFEPFYTTKEPGKGTGLGLATVYGIVKQHQGWVEVISRIGEGTKFKVFLPAITESVSAPAKAPGETEVRGGKEVILLVEDEQPVRMVARHVLEGFGYEVCEAGCASEALEVWGRRGPEISLLFTDIVLPDGISGRELGDKLRAQKPNLKILLTSGYAPESVVADTGFYRVKQNHFLRKPFSSKVLARTVRQCLDEAQTGA